jgi:hypothetical protein
MYRHVSKCKNNKIQKFTKKKKTLKLKKKKKKKKKPYVTD